MLTADQVRNIAFATGLSGYKTGEVDSFVDSCADTIAALTESNEELKRKMKILADKLVEYRQQENSIQSALMSAQRMGDSVVREANQKATLILDDARVKAGKIEQQAVDAVRDKQAELYQLEKEVAAFKKRLLALYKEHLTLIQELPEPEEPEEAETETPAAQEPEAAPAEPTVPEETEPETPAPVQPQEPEAAPAEPLTEGEQVPLWEPETPADEKKDNGFADLQFGEDYPTYR